MTSFLDALRAEDARNQPPAEISVVAVPNQEGDHPYALAALASECSALAVMAPDSGRNATLNKALFNMARHIGAGSIHPDTVRDALEKAAQACRLPQPEIDKVLRDHPNGALTTGQAHPRPVPPRPDPAVTLIEGDPDETHADTVRRLLPLLDWHALWADQDEEEWIIEPILPARRLVALYSAPKVGKSLLMLEMAVAVATGTPTLGVTPDRARRVLYVDFENDPKADIRERLQAMGHGPDELADLCYLSFPTLRALDSEAGSLELLAAIEVYACEVVVIDTVSRAVAGEENENDTWLAFYRHTGLKLKQAGITLIRLDHSGKDETKGQRGGSAKAGDVDAVWRLSRVTDTVFRLDCEANRMQVHEKNLVLHRETAPLRHRVDAIGHRAADDARVDELVKIMDSLDIDPALSRIKVAPLLKAAGQKGARVALFDRAIQARRITVFGTPETPEYVSELSVPEIREHAPPDDVFPIVGNTREHGDENV